MYGFQIRFRKRQGEPDMFRPGGRDWALRHEGDAGNLLEVHLCHIAALAMKRPNVRPIGPLLVDRIAAAQTMYCALMDIEEHGGEAPGPNGLRLESLCNSERWEMCRTMAGDLRSGGYQPGPERKVKIPKSSGKGFRELSIQNLEDRMVARAAVIILDPLVDPTMSPFSYGFRHNRNSHWALATALALTAREGRPIWIAADVANAFDMVPHRRFLDLVRRRFPDDVAKVIDQITCSGKKRGFRQGSPASPFFFNLYADHFVDRAFQKRVADGRLLRYADDLLVLCRTVAEAEEVGAVLSQVARAGGLPLKENMAIINIESGTPIDWLGYRVQWQGGAPAITIAPKAWKKLGADFDEAHIKPFPAIRAVERINAWFDYLGPCYPAEDRDEVVAQVRSLALAQGFIELPSAQEMHDYWLQAFEQWKDTRVFVEGELSTWLAQLPTWKLGAAGGWR